jgi:hypothetical protein
MSIKIDDIENEYYTVEMYSLPKEVREWIKDIYRDGTDSRYYIYNLSIFFKDERDFLMFVLRWSNGG